LGQKMLAVVLFVVTLSTIIPTNHGCSFSPAKSVREPCRSDLSGYHVERLSSSRSTLRYPYWGSYGKNERRVWVITTPPPFTLVFDRMDTEKKYDYVSILWACGVCTACRFGRYTGTDKGKPIYVESSNCQPTVEFKSDGSVQKSGFQMRIIKGYATCFNGMCSTWGIW